MLVERDRLLTPLGAFGLSSYSTIRNMLAFARTGIRTPTARKGDLASAHPGRRVDSHKPTTTSSFM